MSVRFTTFLVAHSANINVIAHPVNANVIADAARTKEFPILEMNKSISRLFCVCPDEWISQNKNFHPEKMNAE